MSVPAATRQSFKEQEALVYQQLAQLIKDAVWLKSYLAAVMRLEQEAFTQAYMALGNTKSSPVVHPHMDAMQLPSTPVEGGMIPAGRPLDSPGQVASPFLTDFLPVDQASMLPTRRRRAVGAPVYHIKTERAIYR